MMFRSLMALLFLAPPMLAAQDDMMSVFRSLPTDGRVLAAGESRDGRLAESDPRAGGDGPYMQAWLLRTTAGQTLTVDLLGDEFDAVLFLVGPGMSEPLQNDDGAGQCNSRITHTFAGGDYRLIVTTFAAFGSRSPTGPFTLRASTTPPPVAEGACDLFGASDEFEEHDQPDVTVEALNALPLAGRLRRGDSTTGALMASAPEIGGGRHGLAYEVSGPAGGALTIDLASTAFDTYLFVVHGNHAEPLTDDDAGGACNSRLTVTLPESGRIRVVVSSFGGGAEGPFALGAYREAPPARQGSCGTTSRFDANAIAALPATGRIAVGETRDGELTPTDQQLDAYHVDVWELTGRAGESAVIDLVSTEFDAYLGVTGPGLVGALSDDDGAGRCNSRVAVTFPESGTFRIVATTFRDAATGAYTLAVGREAGPVQEGGCSFARESGRRLNALPLRGTLEAGGRVTGRLDDASPVLSGGSFASAYALDVRAGEVYTVDLISDSFDAFLLTVSPEGVVTDDDDCGSGTDSRLVLRPTARGRWRVVASSFTAAEGSYTITVTQGEPEQACGEAFGWTDEGVDYDDAPMVGRLQVGDEYRGELTHEDVRHFDGSRMQAFELTGRAGERATVDLLSPEFDAYLIVMGRGLDEMLTDDDSGGACNSRITLTFPESGVYRVIVNTLMEEQFGSYILRVSAVEGPVAPGDCELP